ncbi:MAG TPA: pyridoxamine 5'-phosphate oxidase family protein, partial [Candidatus Acidoferrales bacterium]|nr:pyridoxamine 5'-phosphate oxidase family protein [Candidatus Acidoferrales bacterium]
RAPALIGGGPLCRLPSPVNLALPLNVPFLYPSPMSANPAPSSRVQVKRLPERGHYDRETVHAILDQTFLCHVGFVADGQPFVIPTGFGRDGEVLYIHGSAASRMLRSLAEGIPVCVTVTLLDGLVLARSVFHHSMNYRSVVIVGTARPVTEREEMLRALRAISEQIVPGRWDDARQPTDQEMKATSVLSLPLAECSAKIRTGPPKDEKEDYALPVWAGVLPLRVAAAAPEADPVLPPAIAKQVPAYLQNYRTPGSR